MKYLIWSIEHTAWWRPSAHGYTTSVSDAGVYTKEAAEQIIQSANRVAFCEAMIPASMVRSDHEERVSVLRVALEVQQCSVCRNTGMYTPHCYKCDDSTWDHNDCPKPVPCEEEPCIIRRAALEQVTNPEGRALS